MVSMVYLVSANFSYFISTNGWPGGGGGNSFSPNSSETTWNFQMPFCKMEAGSLRMVYVNFHKPICPRDFSVGRGGLGQELNLLILDKNRILLYVIFFIYG